MAPKRLPTHSQAFFDLVRAIGDCKSKQEEDKIIAKEIQNLKAVINKPDTSTKLMQEYLVRLVYCEMLGHPAEFGHIHAVRLIPSKNLMEKRAAYLAVTLCIPPDAELMQLAVAPMQKDLGSNNYLEVCIALTACCKMLNAELIPCVIQTVTGLLTHSNALVRKKAVMAIHAFYRIDPNSVGSDLRVYRQALCDKDPSVMGASLNLVYDFAMADPDAQRDLVEPLVGIFSQIIGHSLSREYDYNRLPAPWMQIKLLKLLSVLCSGVRSSVDEKVFESILEAMRRSDSGINIGHAIIYECVKTATSIWPNPQLMEAAADAIAKFVTSASPNLKYLGITSLSAVVRIDAKYAAQHQRVVIEALEDSDETIRRRTLELLYSMTTSVNVEVIVARLLKFLAQATDNYLKADLVARITNLAWRYRPNNLWYVGIVIQVLTIASRYVAETTIQNTLRLIAEGPDAENDDEDDDDDNEGDKFRWECAKKFLNLLEAEKKYPDVLYQVIAWTLGEYGFLLQNPDHGVIAQPRQLIEHMIDLLDRPHEDTETAGWIVAALMKLTSQYAGNADVQAMMADVVKKFGESHSTDLQQRSREFAMLLSQPDTFAVVQPLDGCCAELEVDAGLSFIQPLIDDCLKHGYKPYKLPESFQLEENKNTGLKIDAYELPAELQHKDTFEDIETSFEPKEEELQLNKPKAQRWGNPTAEEAAEENGTTETSEQTGTTTATTTTEVGKGKGKKKDRSIPPKLTKEELETAALFGGQAAVAALKAQRAAERAAAKKKKGKDEPAVTPTSTYSPPTAQSSGPWNAVTTPTGVPPQAAAPAAQPPAAAPAPQAPAKGTDFDDIFGGASQPAAAAPVASPFGAFGAPPVAGLTVRLPTAPTTARAPGQKNAAVVVEYQKAYPDNELAFVVHVKALARVAQVNVRAMPPSNFSFTIESTETPKNSNAATLKEIPANAEASVLITLQLKGHGFGQVMVQVGYVDGAGAQGVLVVNIPVLPNDVIRPGGVTDLNGFSAAWLAMNGKEDSIDNFAIPPAIGTASALTQKLAGILNVSTVHVAATQLEFIVSGRLISLSPDQSVLVHCMITPSGLQMKVRSSEKTVATAVAQHIRAYLPQ